MPLNRFNEDNGVHLTLLNRFNANHGVYSFVLNPFKGYCATSLPLAEGCAGASRLGGTPSAVSAGGKRTGGTRKYRAERRSKVGGTKKQPAKGAAKINRGEKCIRKKSCISYETQLLTIVVQNNCYLTLLFRR